MVEVFGGTLALLIIVFILLNMIVSQDMERMLDRSTEDAEFRVSWQDGSEGLVVITYPGRLRILETNETVAEGDLCSIGSPFLRYVERIYNGGPLDGGGVGEESARGEQGIRRQIIFAITAGSVTTTAIARNCLRGHFPGRIISIGWIIANRDLLSSVSLQELPARIKRSMDVQAPSLNSAQPPSPPL